MYMPYATSMPYLSLGAAYETCLTPPEQLSHETAQLRASSHKLVIIHKYLYMMLISLRLRSGKCYVCSLITGRQLRAARALIGWEQIKLAKRSRVAIGTIRRMESFSGEIGSRTSTLSQVQATLEKAGIEFLND